MKHAQRLKRQRARRQADDRETAPKPARPLWWQMFILTAMGTLVIWALLLNSGLVPNIFGVGKWTQEFFPTDPRVAFGEALDDGQANVEAAKAIVDDDYRLVGEMDDGLPRPIGVTCTPGQGPNWTDRSQYRLIVGDPDLLVRSDATDPRQIRVRKYYGEAYNKAVVTFDEYPYKDACKYTGTRLEGERPLLPNRFGIVPRRDTETQDEDDTRPGDQPAE